MESQRGGHGYIRVIRLCLGMPEERANHIEELVGTGERTGYQEWILANLQHRELITARERLLVEVATRFQEEIGRDLLDLSAYKRESLHAELLKQLLRSLALG